MNASPTRASIQLAQQARCVAAAAARYHARSLHAACSTHLVLLPPLQLALLALVHRAYAGTPSWVQDRRAPGEQYNNHNWVEVWDNGTWSFTGEIQCVPQQHALATCRVSREATATCFRDMREALAYTPAMQQRQESTCAIQMGKQCARRHCLLATPPWAKTLLIAWLIRISYPANSVFQTRWVPLLQAHVNTRLLA